MELVLKSNDENSIDEIISLAKKLNVIVEKRDSSTENNELVKERILSFKAKGSSSFGDAAEWEIEQRKDRNIPFSK